MDASTKPLNLLIKLPDKSKTKIACLILDFNFISLIKLLQSLYELYFGLSKLYKRLF